MGLIALLLFLARVSLALEVAVGFGKLTSDEDIIRLLEKCNAKIRAIWYESPYGTGGSFSRKDWHTPSELFRDFRETLVDGYGQMYFSLLVDLKVIEENDLLSVEDLENYPKLMKFVKGLVNGYYQYYQGYFYIKNKSPIVYAVLAKVDDAGCLENSNIVKDISVNYFPLFHAFLKYIPYYFRPKEYDEYYFFPEIKNAKPEELYQMIEKAVLEHENNKEFIEYFEKFYIKTGFYKKRLEFLKKSIEDDKKRSFEENTPPSQTYFPNEGDILYTGTDTVRYNIIRWDNPGDWSVDMPGYEHDLVARNDYFTGCVSDTSLPRKYDDCPTACISESSGSYCAFSFGTYNALLIEPGFPYEGWVRLTRGSAGYTDFSLNAQEVFHSPICFKFLNRWICIPCPFDTPWCMGGTPYRDGNPDLNCPRNSIALKRCQFRRLFPYTSSWSGKYDCTDAGWCD